MLYQNLVVTKQEQVLAISARYELMRLIWKALAAVDCSLWIHILATWKSFVETATLCLRYRLSQSKFSNVEELYYVRFIGRVVN